MRLRKLWNSLSEQTIPTTLIAVYGGAPALLYNNSHLYECWAPCPSHWSWEIVFDQCTSRRYLILLMFQFKTTKALLLQITSYLRAVSEVKLHYFTAIPNQWLTFQIACTAVITEISYHKEKFIAATISFLSEEEWRAELSILLSDLKDVDDSMKRTSDLRSEAGIAWHKVHYPMTLTLSSRLLTYVVDIDKQVHAVYPTLTLDKLARMVKFLTILRVCELTIPQEIYGRSDTPQPMYAFYYL